LRIGLQRRRRLIAGSTRWISVQPHRYGAVLLDPLAPIYDNDAWLSALNGHVATSRHGDRVLARATNPEDEWTRYHYLRADISFHTEKKIGDARLVLRVEPQSGLFVMVERIEMRPEARGLGIGSSIVAFWMDALRALGVTAMYFRAVGDPYGLTGRTFWAREGVLFRDSGEPARLFDAYLASVISEDTDEIEPERGQLSWWQRLLRREEAPRRAASNDDETRADALRALKSRIEAGGLATPADLYAHPLGRQVLAAGDWRGWWPISDR
jgi:GNAT superfamily N-acetyltransferase